MTNKPLLLAICAGLFVGLVAAIAAVAPQAWNTPKDAQETGKALIGGPFSLVDQTGRRVTDKDFAGKPMIVFFGFTNCPNICPSGLQVISAALDKLGPKGESIAAVFITLDPERDTPDALARYLKSFHPRLIGLTGTTEEVAAAAKAYRVYAKKVTDSNFPGGYSIDHSGFMYLMDAKGEYLRHFPHSVGVDDLAAALAKTN